MVNHKKDYDTALEGYSKPLMKKIRYEFKQDHSLTVTNPETVEAYFRYPDFTSQCIYLATTIQETIKEDIYPEMVFLVKYDETKAAIQEIVDMPDRYIDLLIKLLHQNKGVLSTILNPVERLPVDHPKGYKYAGDHERIPFRYRIPFEHEIRFY